MRLHLARRVACLALAALNLRAPASAQDQDLAVFLRSRASGTRMSPRSERLLVAAATKAGLVRSPEDIAVAKALLAELRREQREAVSTRGTPASGSPLVTAGAEAENNDHLGLADPLDAGSTTVTGHLTLDDVDTFRIVVPVDSAVQLSTSGSGASPIADTVLAITDADGQLVDLDDDGGPGLLSRIDAQLPAGTYHVQVQSGSRATGDYQLAVNMSPVVIPVLASGQPVQAAFTLPTQRHTWRLPVGVSSAVRVITSGIRGDLMLQFCRSSLSEVHLVDDSAAGGPYPALETRTPAGVWYLVVQPFPGTRGGAYSLAVTLTPQSVPYAPCNSSVSSVLAGAESHDVYRLVNASPPRVTLATAPGSLPALTDSVLEIFDQSFARVTWNDDAATGHSLIDTMLPPGLYYVVVRPWPGDHGGYTLRTTCGQSATVNTLPNGRTTATLARVGDTAAFSYAVATEVPVAFRTDLAASTISRGLVTVLDGAGRVRAFDDGTLTSSGNALCGATLATGNYTVLVRDWSAGTGTVDLLVRPPLHIDPRGPAAALHSLDKAGRLHILFVSNTAGPGIPLTGAVTGTFLLHPSFVFFTGAALIGVDGNHAWPLPLSGFGGTAQAVALDLASITGAMTNLER